MNPRLAFFLLSTLGAGSPAAGALWQGRLDLRDLPANTRPASISVQVDARRAVALGFAPVISIAVNRLVIARTTAGGSGMTRLQVPLQDRLLSVGNELEVTASLPGCDRPACRDALATIRPAAPARAHLSGAQEAPTDFSQLVTRLRAGVAVEASGAHGQRLADLFLAELAPHAPRLPGGPARLFVGREAPAGTTPHVRFDLGPVRLVRSDGASILSEADLDRYTTVQVLRFGAEPVIWIRPGDAASIPSRLELDAGDVAIFSAERREIAFSTRRDRAVEIAYGQGVDAQGGARNMMIFRLALLAIWIAASLFLFRVFRKLPRPTRSDAAA